MGAEGKSKGQRLGERLVARGVVDAAMLQRALAHQKAHGVRLGSALAAVGVDHGEIVAALGEQQGVPGVDLPRSVLDLQHLALIPREVAEIEAILPIGVDGGKLLLALADPQNARVLEEVQLISGLTVLPHVALASTLGQVIRAAYDAAALGVKRWRGESAAKDATGPVLRLDAPAEEEISIEVDEGGSGQKELELGTVSARPGPRLILIVDDEEEILTLVAKALEKNGYRVEKARRGQEALDRVSELLPDLLLLDANLPEVHGFDVCKRVKANPRYARMPVIMMTAVYRGWRFAHDTRESFGADDYIEKPFRLDDLRRRVDHHLQRAIGEPHRDRQKADQLYEQAARLLEASKVKEALPLLEQAAEADAFSPRIQYQLGRALQVSGDVYRAIAAYERAVDLRPDHFPTLRSLAALYQQKGFRRKAIEAWERAIPAAPDDATREKIKTSLLALL